MQGYEVKQSSTAYPLVFLLVSSTDHVNPVTGATPTVTISKAGGAFAAPAGAVSEIGSGWYKVAGNATDTASLGPLILHATAAGADPTDALYPVVAVDPQSATGFVSSVPAVAGTVGGNVSGSVGSVTGSVGSVVGNVGGNVVGSVASVTGAVGGVAGNVAGSVASVASAVTVGGYSAGQDPATLVLDATASAHNTAGTIGHDINAAGTASDPWTTALPGSYAAGTAGYIVGHNLDAQVSTRLATSSYAAAPTTAQIATAIWTDLTAGSDFSTASSVGSLIKANLDAAVSTRSTFAGGAVASVTGNVGGNVVGSVGSVAAAVAIDQTRPLGTPRTLNGVADASVTVGDGLWCAVAAAAGKESITGTTYLVQTPSTGTTIRTFTLDSSTSPTSRT